MFFLDYISCGKLEIKKMEQIVSGIVAGCKLCGAALVGGETAEHPGTMKPDEYDLAGFAVGAVEKSEMIDGKNIQAGDVIIGIESSGPHSNGYSLLRKLYLKNGELPSDKETLSFIADYLMKPTHIYVESILKLLLKEEIKGMIHITGGGFYENIPRILKKEHGARIIKKDLPESYVFNKIRKDHSLDERDMYSTFNMGVGFILIIPKDRASQVLQELSALGESAKVIGEVISRKDEEVEMI